MSETQIWQRKLESEALLKREGVPYLDWLPALDAEREHPMPTQQEVAFRALCLCLVAVKGEGLEQDMVLSVLDRYGLEPHLSPQEREYIHNPEPSEHQRVQFCWRYEAYWTLLWALSFVDKFEKPTEICDVPFAVTFMQKQDIQTFLKDSRLRDGKTFMDAADLYYRYHWVTRNAQLKGEPLPSSLEGGVVMERRHALWWLIGSFETGWDDVRHDT